ncbi:hypothetical protein AVEN_266022-1 [Araneus ventricosus]|uniref:Uncharacterized protein n=1 Tax=Araneus ventricosus TaxID=182803 RepID=A0A4Y2ILB8_ARAVE|nr:hypothetical protein AVEN_266022-1 [Araneus ventricosus]
MRVVGLYTVNRPHIVLGYMVFQMDACHCAVIAHLGISRLRISMVLAQISFQACRMVPLHIQDLEIASTEYDAPMLLITVSGKNTEFLKINLNIERIIHCH